MFEYMCFFKANIRTSFLSNFDSPSVYMLVFVFRLGDMIPCNAKKLQSNLAKLLAYGESPACHCHTRVRRHITAKCRFAEAAQLLLSAELVSNLFAVLLSLVCCTCLMFDCVRKVCHSVKVFQYTGFAKF